MEFLGKLLLGVWLFAAALFSLSGEGTVPIPNWLEWLSLGVTIAGLIVIAVVNFWPQKPRRDRGDLDIG